MTDATDPGEVVIIGKRPTKMQESGYEEAEHISEDPNGGPSGGNVYTTDAQVRAEEQRQRDCAADAFHQKLQAIGTKNSKESFSYILNRNGNTAITNPVTGTGTVVTGADRTAVIQAQNIQYSEIEGFAHNHPNGPYCNQQGWSIQEKGLARAINSYPSLNDWIYADGIVGANPSVADSFTLYITGCDNELRAYPYSNREYYRDQVQRLNPPPLQPVLAAVCG